ncbi:glycogen/starch/alpha-glucan phosphorylase [Fusibacter sp. A1]|uniref:glycogen/starch/alpha-glucan phosphorylase n=1 Tax=Fusibacter sp. A2 TaxID=2929473 RepID=UPI0010108648|nr:MULTISPECIES: glycogen/starch/alpha-glucan phosphorylase [unclassified Fusibacter]MCK8059404.1 glycogen/starch/alpha-glucan phosphorylase [Fusibacter sp. A2]NPE21132.1 glycogen/starch/alpha-glucan phosphorylase [Fusibacter sp. A1]RXV62401.1 glycogen/starch/alpha-glucan phosphorylase [Fusibacter sp. A1]
MLRRDDLKQAMNIVAQKEYGVPFERLDLQGKYEVLSGAIISQISPDWSATEAKYQEGKRAFYLSAEFLMGRALGNNLINLRSYDDVKSLMEEFGVDLNALEEVEYDAGLGNGGLGRLAACFLDSCATLNLPVTGYGIKYKYGLFKQYFEDGFQKELPDAWMTHGDPWTVRKDREAVEVVFEDMTVKAVPYDMPIIGFDTKNINTLRLWQAESVEPFDFEAFNHQAYDKAVAGKNRAEDISRVLYPNDDTEEGKLLRIKQQYFFVSASIQDMVKKHKAAGRKMDKFHKYHSIQLNDTHPAVAVPELIRLLMADGIKFEEALMICQNTCDYTNHTILAEALEQWSVEAYESILPEIVKIIKKIDLHLHKLLTEKNIDIVDMLDYKIIDHGNIKMAWLSIYGSSRVNGVAALHTQILIDSELNHWYKLFPEKFVNKTNGITQRRWIYYSNRELSDLITELIGDESWVTDLDQLRKLEKFADNEEVLKRFMAIKRVKKQQLADYIEEHEGIKLNVDAIFDIQIKRLHEYKRQLLNAFHILDLYHRIKADPKGDWVPRAFIFGAKAAPGYFRAKGVIKFINDIASLVNNDPEIGDLLKVVFVENYRVSYAERLFTGADLSEQISTAGKEASGTGNMKFMLNGTPTIGTLDGANVEIVEEAGEENNFIFGLKVEDIAVLHSLYSPTKPYKNTSGLKKVVDSLVDGTFDDEETGMFEELFESLMKGASWHEADNYYILADFESYREAHDRVAVSYKDELGWAKKCWMNMCGSGKFSSDRTIAEYASEIWHVTDQKL